MKDYYSKQKRKEYNKKYRNTHKEYYKKKVSDYVKNKGKLLHNNYSLKYKDKINLEKFKTNIRLKNRRDPMDYKDYYTYEEYYGKDEI